MKASLALTLTAALASTTACFGQAYISFANTSNNRVSTNGVVIPISPIGDWYYALLVAPSTQNTVNTRNFTGWTFVGLGTNTTVGSGRLNGNTTTDFGIQVPGYASTALADFIVVGWSANVGHDWNTVRTEWAAYGYEGPWSIVDSSRPGGSGRVYFGVSSVAQDIQLGPAGGPYNTIFGSANLGLIPGLNLDYIPEPSAFALAVPGCAALLLRSRKGKYSSIPS